MSDTKTAAPSPARGGGAATRSDAPPSLVKRAMTAAFGEMSGMALRHTLLQFLSLGEGGERDGEKNDARSRADPLLRFCSRPHTTRTQTQASSSRRPS
jgi:hypothetical protein